MRMETKLPYEAKKKKKRLDKTASPLPVRFSDISLLLLNEWPCFRGKLEKDYVVIEDVSQSAALFQNGSFGAFESMGTFTYDTTCGLGFGKPRKRHEHDDKTDLKVTRSGDIIDKMEIKDEFCPNFDYETAEGFVEKADKLVGKHEDVESSDTLDRKKETIEMSYLSHNDTAESIAFWLGKTDSVEEKAGNEACCDQDSTNITLKEDKTHDSCMELGLESKKSCCSVGQEGRNISDFDMKERVITDCVVDDGGCELGPLSSQMNFDNQNTVNLKSDGVESDESEKYSKNTVGEESITNDDQGHLKNISFISQDSKSFRVLPQCEQYSAVTTVSNLMEDNKAKGDNKIEDSTNTSDKGLMEDDEAKVDNITENCTSTSGKGLLISENVEQLCLDKDGLGIRDFKSSFEDSLNTQVGNTLVCFEVGSEGTEKDSKGSTEGNENKCKSERDAPSESKDKPSYTSSDTLNVPDHICDKLKNATAEIVSKGSYDNASDDDSNCTISVEKHFKQLVQNPSELIKSSSENVEVGTENRFPQTVSISLNSSELSSNNRWSTKSAGSNMENFNVQEEKSPISNLVCQEIMSSPLPICGSNLDIAVSGINDDHIRLQGENKIVEKVDGRQTVPSLNENKFSVPFSESSGTVMSPFKSNVEVDMCESVSSDFAMENPKQECGSTSITSSPVASFAASSSDVALSDCQDSVMNSKRGESSNNSAKFWGSNSGRSDAPTTTSSNMVETMEMFPSQNVPVDLDSISNNSLGPNSNVPRKIITLRRNKLKNVVSTPQASNSATSKPCLVIPSKVSNTTDTIAISSCQASSGRISSKIYTPPPCDRIEAVENSADNTLGTGNKTCELHTSEDLKTGRLTTSGQTSIASALEIFYDSSSSREDATSAETDQSDHSKRRKKLISLKRTFCLESNQKSPSDSGEDAVKPVKTLKLTEKGNDSERRGPYERCSNAQYPIRNKELVTTQESFNLPKAADFFQEPEASSDASDIDNSKTSQTDADDSVTFLESVSQDVDCKDEITSENCHNSAEINGKVDYDSTKVDEECTSSSQTSSQKEESTLISCETVSGDNDCDGSHQEILCTPENIDCDTFRCNLCLDLSFLKRVSNDGDKENCKESERDYKGLVSKQDSTKNENDLSEQAVSESLAEGLQAKPNATSDSVIEESKEKSSDDGLAQKVLDEGTGVKLDSPSDSHSNNCRNNFDVTPLEKELTEGGIEIASTAKRKDCACNSITTNATSTNICECNNVTSNATSTSIDRSSALAVVPNHAEVNGEPTNEANTNNLSYSEMDYEKLNQTEDVFSKEDGMSSDKPEKYCLMLEEAMFLSYCLGMLIVSQEGQVMDIDQMWSTFCDLKSDFPVQYTVYHHFRVAGWVVKSGLKFGTDWVLYPYSPEYYHSQHLVWLECLWKETLEPVACKRRRKFGLSELAALERLGSHVAKNVLICQVLRPLELQDEALKSIECLKKFEICESIVRRWRHGDKPDVASGGNASKGGAS